MHNERAEGPEKKKNRNERLRNRIQKHSIKIKEFKEFFYSNTQIEEGQHTWVKKKKQRNE